MASVQPSEIPPYQQAVYEVLAALGADARRGLTDERRESARTTRPERTGGRPAGPAWRKFLAQFQDVLVILLLVATAISAGLWLYERDSALPYEAMAICAVVLLNALMGYIQESRAESAVAALRQMAAAHAHVIRDGEQRSVDATEVVPGDIILIEEGDTIPADARVIHIDGAADGGSGADRRESSGHERTWRRSRESGTRRPRQHDFQRHGGDLRPRTGGRRRDRDADRNGAHRRMLRDVRTSRRRCRRSSTASARCWESSWSRSPS